MTGPYVALAVHDARAGPVAALTTCDARAGPTTAGRHFMLGRALPDGGILKAAQVNSRLQKSTIATIRRCADSAAPIAGSSIPNRSQFVTGLALVMTRHAKALLSVSRLPSFVLQ